MLYIIIFQKNLIYVYIIYMKFENVNLIVYIIITFYTTVISISEYFVACQCRVKSLNISSQPSQHAAPVV